MTCPSCGHALGMLNVWYKREGDDEGWFGLGHEPTHLRTWIYVLYQGETLDLFRFTCSLCDQPLALFQHFTSDPGDAGRLWLVTVYETAEDLMEALL